VRAIWEKEMADIPVITHVLVRTDSITPKWPVLVLLECETETGKAVFRMTGEAAHELRGHLEKLPPKIGRRTDLRTI